MSSTDSFGNFFFLPGSDNKCPGTPFTCAHPSACSRDPTTGRYFCCDPDSVCYAGVTSCASDGSTFECGTGTDNTWCCTRNSEACTGTSSQINVCWSKVHDVLVDIDKSLLNEAFSSLSSADPEATSWVFKPQSLTAATETTSRFSTGAPVAVPSSTDTSASPTTTANDTPTEASSQAPPTPSDASSSKSLSGGAIGGIVVGAVAGVIIIALALFFLRRRRNKEKTAYEGVPWTALQPKEEQGPAHELPAGKQEPLHELPSGRQVAELPASEVYRYQ